MKEINEKYSKEIYWNILKAIIVMTYFLALNFAYINVKTEYVEIGSKIITMIFLAIGIFIIEKAYKNDDGNMAIQGIEVLVLATYTLTTNHVVNKFEFNFKSYSLVASYLYAIYYLIRGIYIYTKGKKEEVDNLSDIREIVKKEEPVKKEAIKKNEKKGNNTNKTTNKTEKVEKVEKVKNNITVKKKDEGKEND